MKTILTFHPNLRRYLEVLMSDPNPQGQAFLTLAMLNNASIRYRDGLLDANPGCAGMPLGSFSAPFQWDLAAPRKEADTSTKKPRVRLMAGGNEQPLKIWVCVGSEGDELTGWGVSPLGAYLDWERLNPRIPYWQVLKERLSSGIPVSLPSPSELLRRITLP